MDFTRGPHPVETAPYDDHGHGTHVAGLIAGDGKLSKGFYKGVAPQVALVVLKVLGADGAGDTGTVLAAI